MGYGFPHFISLKNGTSIQVRSFAEQDLYVKNEFWPLNTNKGQPILVVEEPQIENISLDEVDVPELELQTSTIIKKNKRK